MRTLALGLLVLATIALIAVDLVAHGLAGSIGSDGGTVHHTRLLILDAVTVGGVLTSLFLIVRAKLRIPRRPGDRRYGSALTKNRRGSGTG